MVRAWLRRVAVVAGLLALLAIAVPFTGSSSDQRVVVERLPVGGVQPQAVADSTGVVHVVYLRGDDMAGDLFYVRRTSDGAYSAPLRINSQPGNAVARGTVRGAQIALGRGNRVHVVWNGAPPKTLGMAGGLMHLFYSRLSGDAFEPQRNLPTWSGGVDGGGALATDTAGRVFAAWHANPGAGADARGSVFVTRSADDGARFARERRVSSEALGACACCGMRGLIDRAGALHLLYRAAGANIDRDSMLLSSGTSAKRSRRHVCTRGRSAPVRCRPSRSAKGPTASRQPGIRPGRSFSNAMLPRLRRLHRRLHRAAPRRASIRCWPPTPAAKC